MSPESANPDVANGEAANLDALLDDLKQAGRPEAVSVGEVLARFAHRSLGVLIALFGLITVMPIIGDIPGAAILCATLTLIAVAQSVIGRRGLWVPNALARREIDRARFERAIETARPWIRRVDMFLKPRLGVLVASRPARLGVALAAAALALSLYPLAFVPFGANAPGAGLIAFGLGLMAGDGLLVLLGYALIGVTVYVLVAGL